MAIYQKKPVEIEAHQWDGSAASTKFILDWSGDFITHREQHAGGSWHVPEHLLISTLEGNMRAVTGDWIIKGIRGEFYPVSDDVFRASYRWVEDS